MTNGVLNMKYGPCTWGIQLMRSRAEHETLVMRCCSSQGVAGKTVCVLMLKPCLCLYFFYKTNALQRNGFIFFPRDVIRTPFPVPMIGRLSPVFMSYTDNQFQNSTSKY